MLKAEITLDPGYVEDTKIEIFGRDTQEILDHAFSWIAADLIEKCDSEDAVKTLAEALSGAEITVWKKESGA